MSAIPNQSMIEAFEDLSDPRVEGRCEHKLIDIVIIGLCAVITGAESWVEVEAFGKLKEEKLKSFLELAGGIPSHDTFGRVFAALDAEQFQKCFARWVSGVFAVSRGQVIAIDGKTGRGSHDERLGKKAIHRVSAWATRSGIALGQCKVDDKANEITAIPELLRVLDVSACVVTLDALGCQREIAQAIRDEKADYVLRVKENQGKLYQNIADWLAYADQGQWAGMNATSHETVNNGHGRLEIRRCCAIAD